MKSFRQIAIVTLLALAPIGAAYGQNNETAPQYRDILRKCGAEWKGSEARKAVAKGEGAKAWQDFRKKCVEDNGWKGRSRTPSARTA